MIAELAAETGEPSPRIRRFCRYLSERSPQPMVAVEGTTHVVIYVNVAFARLVGRDREELVGRPFAETVPEGHENGCVALLDRVYRSGIPEELAEQEHRQGLPRSVYWSYSVWAILDDEERPAGVMIQVTDATETALFRQQAVAMNEALLVSGLRQHELTEAGKLFSAQMRTAVQTRDHFLAVLSHELRNPLNALSTGLQVLKVDGIDPDVAKVSRGMMERQLKQLVLLVDDLLDISRIATGKLELRKQRVDLATVVRDAVEACRPLIDDGGHDLAVMLPDYPVLLNADPTRLGQIFLNLLNNAAKYSESGGSIRLSAVLDGDEVSVSVRDSGIGISAAHLPKVFDVFVQVDTSWKRAQGGLGIGLSLVKEFVGLHGGTVVARSGGHGQGSEFVVRLPLAVAGAAESLPPSAGGMPLGPHRRILVVDDNRDAAESLAMLLKLLGHEVRTAYDGEAGVSAAADFGPGVILMDLGMPRLDGYEAARRIRAANLDTNKFLIALTGWGADEDRRRTREAGFDAHLIKPVEIDDLLKMMADLPTEAPTPGKSGGA